MQGHCLSTVLIYSAENGKEACAKANALAQQGEKFHLVLMDLTMPVLDGVHATEMLRQFVYHGDAVPIVSVSSRKEAQYPDGGAAVFSDQVRVCRL